ncbi:hypothetical protein Lal_00046514 [Lupinus albus]|nr:hypothetical protein Lal_00046514 [Lupinus albus]
MKKIEKEKKNKKKEEKKIEKKKEKEKGLLASPGEINIPSDYGNVSTSFNVANLSLFETDNEDLDSRSNLVQEGGDDSNPPMAINLDVQMGLRGPITQAKAKKTQGSLGQVILSNLASIGPNDNMRPTNCLLVEDEPFEGHDQA